MSGKIEFGAACAFVGLILEVLSSTFLARLHGFKMTQVCIELSQHLLVAHISHMIDVDGRLLIPQNFRLSGEQLLAEFGGAAVLDHRCGRLVGLLGSILALHACIAD